MKCKYCQLYLTTVNGKTYCLGCNPEQKREREEYLGSAVSNQRQVIIGLRRTIERQNIVIGRLATELELLKKDIDENG